MPKLLDFENRQKDCCGKQQKGRQSRGGSPLAGSLGFGRVGDRRSATRAGVSDQLLLGIPVGLVRQETVDLAAAVARFHQIA
jgi:hypothetical protein